MDTINVNGAIYNLPANNDDVISLVNQAKSQNKKICVRGAAHSFPLIDTLEAEAQANKNMYILLSKMNAITNLDVANKMVTVQAGCHLGFDPFDPTGISTLNNSLLWQLDQKGLAFPDLGGITHQTVGGFLSTGSSGGSTQHAFDDSLMSIDIITCGTNGAQLVTYKRPNPDNPNDPFYAAGVASMGLFGVIVSATFVCVDRFDIIGSETTTTVQNCEIDLFGQGNGTMLSFQNFLQQTEYTRIIWWPQAHVTKAVVWKAAQIHPTPPDFKVIPYEEVPWIAGSPIPATLGADILFTAIGQWPTWLGSILGADDPTYKTITDFVEKYYSSIILPLICDVFVSVGVKQFQDYWWSGLPMDNQMGDRIMPVWFTELWIPINQSQAVMIDLLNFYNQGLQNSGSFCVEIYAAKSSKFWMSPAYQTDVIRIDVFWFGNNADSPIPFYQKFWDLLQKYNFRPHWGKYLPDGAGSQGATYLKSIYPKWTDWMNLRQQNDPNNVFVNDYWSGHLGI